MAHRKHKPIDIEVMLRVDEHDHYTICQLLRDIYMETKSEQIKLKTRVCMSMAKGMVKKLTEYKQGIV